MKTTLAITLLALVAAPSLAMASDDDGRNRWGIDAPRDQWMSIAEVTAKMEAAGYTIREIEIDDGVYEVEGRDANGARIEADVHPVTGEILRRDDKRGNRG